VQFAGILTRTGDAKTAHAPQCKSPKIGLWGLGEYCIELAIWLNDLSVNELPAVMAGRKPTEFSHGR
jgi:hypothetical protein